MIERDLADVDWYPFNSLLMEFCAHRRGGALSPGLSSRTRFGRVIEFPIMTEFGPTSWLPVPISTVRLVLRESESRDRAAFIELFASPDVRTYLGGSRERSELEREIPETPGRRPGVFVVEFRGAMIGMVTLHRRDSVRPGHVRPEADEFELGYMFLVDAWGCGYAAEACMAVLDRFSSSLPDEPVVLCTQTATS